MVILGITMFVIVIRRNRLNLRKKDTEILYREELFSKPSTNVDDVLLMLDAKKLHVDYISSNIEKLVGISEKHARENIHDLDRLVGGRDAVRILDQLPGASEGKGRYELRVKDTGIGMSKEFAARVFNPFERERTSTVSKIQGTGLGMSISKNIIDMMGGTIEVHTDQGKGL